LLEWQSKWKKNRFARAPRPNQSQDIPTLSSLLARLDDFCTRHAWIIVVLAGLLAITSGTYVAQNFKIDTDINKLISPDLPWRKQELAFSRAFPQHAITAVVDAPTSELATNASSALMHELSKRKDLFESVEDPQSSPLFVRNGLLFLPTEDLARTTDALIQAQPLIQTLAPDQTLRGLAQVLSLVLTGVSVNLISLEDLVHPLTMAATTVEQVLAGRFAAFSWRELMRGEPPQPGDLRRFIQIRPILDFASLTPGSKATQAIRQASADLDLAAHDSARVRLTGLVPIEDEEFATLTEGLVPNTIATVAMVLLILWLALKSPRIIVAVVITIFVGLTATAALGLWLVTAFNPISIAFAVLFVGIGVDFGIQYSVRYRAERYELDDLRIDLVRTARDVGAPLTLAAAATAVGFFSFLPTAYGGFSELGEIAGVGMIVAYVGSITLLPALLSLLKPPGEPEPIGFSVLAPIDSFTERHRIPIIITTIIIVLGGLPLLFHLRFDFNPMNLRSPKVESIATYLDLRSDPATGASSIDVLAPSLTAANQMSERLLKLPEVSRVITLETFIPDDQPAKLELIRQTVETLVPTLQLPPKSAPSDQETVTALERVAAALVTVAGDRTTAGADAARRLAKSLSQLASADAALRAQSEKVFIAPLRSAFDDLRNLLQATQITDQTIPREFGQEWIKDDGRARVQVYPKGDPNDNEVLRRFARAVQAVEPTASGGPIAILEAGRSVVTAFIQAGVMAVISITILLWIALRRFGDVLLTLVPLLLAGAVTLEICVAIGLQLNFANIIALPVLLGVGVAFKIYYIMAWRAGQTGLLQSSLTRAVIFSAMTTATAFGSLWLSSHPGTSSMGKLMALTLACTMFAAVLFQPLLMGRPRDTGKA
jgi:hopanoid biosynthesis associated RND transporter like protein HpnN